MTEQTKVRLTYEEWVETVDRYVFRLVGCSVDDLADAKLADMYADEYTPLEAAKEAIKYSDDFGMLSGFIY